MIAAKCKCGAELKVPDRFAGKLGRCPRCGDSVRVPGFADPATKQTTSAKALETKPSSAPAATAADADIPLAGEQDGQSPEAGLAAAAGRAATRSVSPPPRVAERLGPAAQSGFPNPATVLAGVLLLATVLIPWMVADVPAFADGEFDTERQTIMSWNILQEAPGEIVALIVGCWLIGLAALTLGLVLRGLSLSVSKLVLGLAGLILLIVAAASMSDSSNVPELGRVGSRMTLSIFSVVFLFVMVVSTHLRLRLEDNLVFHGAQGASASILVILTIIGLFLGISDYGDLPAVVREALGTELVVGIVLQLMVIAACILATAHAFGVRDESPTLSLVSLGLIYAMLGGTAVYLLIGPAVRAEEAGLVLLFLNMLFLLGPVVYLLGSGVIGVVSDSLQAYGKRLRAGAGGSAAPAAAGEAGANPHSARSRLSELEDLRQQGFLTEQEFQQRRARIINEL